MLSNIDVQKLLPHRYPFLLVDKVLEVEPGKRVVAVKNVTVNEPFFQGHFPGNPIMPGVLIVEALAQASGIAVAMMEEGKNKLGVFAAIDSMKFKKQIVPGDVLMLEGEIISYRMGVAKAKVKATVDGTLAAEGEIKFAMVDV
ncbi:MAG TPA: 3-hydroxyacyl-ACP dehydratase FabZ [Clostridiaceae bacterium]|nr:3-hydroxyacyl-ACP dehydratase FabZ [Clostridiaceae bacterium]